MLGSRVLALTVTTVEWLTVDRRVMASLGNSESSEETTDSCRSSRASGFSCSDLIILRKRKQTESQGLWIRLLTETRDPRRLLKVVKCGQRGFLSYLGPQVTQGLRNSCPLLSSGSTAEFQQTSKYPDI